VQCNQDVNQAAAAGFTGNNPCVPQFASTASATVTASATATPTALASTGGPPLAVPLTLVASVALVGSGIVALRTVLRRGGASS
jgi:hypothetical protein